MAQGGEQQADGTKESGDAFGTAKRMHPRTSGAQEEVKVRTGGGVGRITSVSVKADAREMDRLWVLQSRAPALRRVGDDPVRTAWQAPFLREFQSRSCRGFELG